jgi:autotransporter-associated beta strand protein
MKRTATSPVRWARLMARCSSSAARVRASAAYGAPIDINFGGAGATVVWGSPEFNPGNFTLNGGNATHAATLVNDLDLGGLQRYIRLDGNPSAAERAAMGVIAGDIFNGGVAKRGGGTLIFDNAKTYEGGTVVSQGALWLRGTGTAGANVVGNDIHVNPDGYLRIESPDNIGSSQAIILYTTGTTLLRRSSASVLATAPVPTLSSAA